MRDTIRILEEIQKIDLDISSIEAEEKNYLKRISEAEAEISTLDAFSATVNAELSDLDARVKEAEERIRQSSEKTQKTEKRIGDIKSDKELNALNKELGAANKSKKLSEEELGKLRTKTDEKKKLLEEKASLVAGKKTELSGITEELNSKKAAWSAAIAEKQGAKAATASKISPSILKKYETIRSRRGGVGLALVKNEACQACNIHIPPQVYIQLKKGVDELLTCPHCHRILHVESDAN